MFERVKDRLINEWKGSWKLWSVQLNALGLVLMSFGEIFKDSWNQLPESLASHIPHAEVIGMLLFGLSLIARLCKQGK
jgi:hypothetical protein